MFSWLNVIVYNSLMIYHAISHTITSPSHVKQRQNNVWEYFEKNDLMLLHLSNTAENRMDTQYARFRSFAFRQDKVVLMRMLEMNNIKWVYKCTEHLLNNARQQLEQYNVLRIDWTFLTALNIDWQTLNRVYKPLSILHWTNLFTVVQWKVQCIRTGLIEVKNSKIHSFVQIYAIDDDSKSQLQGKFPKLSGSCSNGIAIVYQNSSLIIQDSSCILIAKFSWLNSVQLYWSYLVSE